MRAHLSLPRDSDIPQKRPKHKQGASLAHSSPAYPQCSHLIWEPAPDKSTRAYPFSSTRYNCLYVVGCWWLPSPRSVWKAAIGVRLRLNRKTNSSR